MRPFGFLTPRDPAAAIAAVTGRPGATFLAGGTNLVDLMKLGVAAPDLLVDVTGLLPDQIEPTAAGGLRIGAGVRNSDLAADPRVRAAYPMLARAVLAAGSGPQRHMGLHLIGLLVRLIVLRRKRALGGRIAVRRHQLAVWREGYSAGSGSMPGEEHGHDRRQPAAAHPLRVLPGRD